MNKSNQSKLLYNNINTELPSSLFWGQNYWNDRYFLCLSLSSFSTLRISRFSMETFVSHHFCTHVVHRTPARLSVCLHKFACAVFIFTYIRVYSID